MGDENTQKELFEFEKPKRSLPRLFNILPKADFEGKVAVTLTLEKIVFIAIAVIMLMVVVFALGVEKGKLATRPAISLDVPAAPITLPATAPLAAKSNAAATATTIKIKTVPIAKVPPVPISTPAVKQAGPYTIIAAAFRNKDTAVRETGRLKQSGLDAVLVQDGRYFKICVGTYANKENAESALYRVRQIYKDAYIKMR